MRKKTTTNNTTTTTTSTGTLKRTLNEREAVALFDDLAVFVCGADMFPKNRAVELFGMDATVWGIFDGIDGEIVHAHNVGAARYIDYDGYLRMVSYHNATLYDVDTRSSREAGGAAVVDIADYNGRRAAAR